MQVVTIIFERIPIVWVLLGLLFNAAGLYLGFEYSLAFGYMIIGWFCLAYGLALIVIRRMEGPTKATDKTRLSPKFISVGSTVMMPAMPNAGNEHTPERSDVE